MLLRMIQNETMAIEQLSRRAVDISFIVEAGIDSVNWSGGDEQTK